MKRRDYPPLRFLRPHQSWLAGSRRHPNRTIAAFWIVLSIISVKSISGIDLNNDGMSDVWQQKYSVPSADANLDYDGTGLTNSQKSLLGLAPRDPNSRFHLEIVSDSANNQLHLRLDTVFGKLYLPIGPCEFWCVLVSTTSPLSLSTRISHLPNFARAVA